MKRFPAFTLCFLLCPLLSFAQVDKGSLLGTVADTSRASIPQAVVTAIETNTGISRTTNTNEAGNYSFPLLDPGVYRVEIEHQGFKKTVRGDIRLDANSAVRADFTLELGAVTESVNVTAGEIAILQTDRADVSQKIESQTLQNLPLTANRNYAGTLALVPGATRPFIAHSAFYNSQDSLSTNMNGQDRHANNFLVEGIQNNWDNGNLTILVPPVEAIQTVDVSTSNYDAEFGRVAGAVTNVIFRSGTNSYHGSLFEFNKVSALASRNFFVGFVPPQVYNQFGATFGTDQAQQSVLLHGLSGQHRPFRRQPELHDSQLAVSHGRSEHVRHDNLRSEHRRGEWNRTDAVCR